MSAGGPTIERLTHPVAAADLRGLAELLDEAVEGGAAVSFVAPLSVAEAEAWWKEKIESSHPRAVFLVARDREGIAGSVQLHPAWAPNQPRRADVAKLLVRRRCQRTGLGAHLMRAIEETARREGFDLLTLDAESASAADRLYRRCGWTPVGTIPAFAVDPDGTTPHDAVVFYKRLDATTPAAALPEGWHAVTPRIVARDARGLVDFLRAVFDATGEYRSERPSEIRIGDSVVMITDTGARPPMPAFLYVSVADADAICRRAIARGARTIEEPTDTPYGDRRAMVEDRWGNTWQIATRRRPAERE